MLPDPLACDRKKLGDLLGAWVASRLYSNIAA